MCVSCLAESYFICELFPGWSLIRATKDYFDDDFHWNNGELALVKCNEPEFIFPFEPKEDPMFYATEEDMNEYYKNNDDVFTEQAVLLQESFIFSPSIGHDLIEAAMTKGFNKQELVFEFWFIQKVAEAVKEFDKGKENEILALTDYWEQHVP